MSADDRESSDPRRRGAKTGRLVIRTGTGARAVPLDDSGEAPVPAERESTDFNAVPARSSARGRAMSSSGEESSTTPTSPSPGPPAGFEEATNVVENPLAAFQDDLLPATDAHRGAAASESEDTNPRAPPPPQPLSRLPRPTPARGNTRPERPSPARGSTRPERPSPPRAPAPVITDDEQRDLAPYEQLEEAIAEFAEPPPTLASPEHRRRRPTETGLGVPTKVVKPGPPPSALPPPVPADALGSREAMMGPADEVPHPSQQLDALRPGTTVGGRYTIISSLGQGGMAEVYLAQQVGVAGFSKTVVLKRILPNLARDQRFVDLFVREALVASSLTHPNIVQLFELGEDDGTYFIAMEYVRGMSLEELALHTWKRNRSLPLELVLVALADAAEGLSYAWRAPHPDGGEPMRLVHRDVSPDNLIVNVEGLTKILDFGIAKGEKSADLTRAGELKGKMSYIAPEELRSQPRDHRGDLYSLGATAYWLMTGRLPFKVMSPMDLLEKVAKQPPEPPSSLNPAIPPPVEDLVLRLLRKDPNTRPQDGEEIVEEILAMLGPAARRSPSGRFLQAALEEAKQPPPPLPDHRPPGAVPITDVFDEDQRDPMYRRGSGTFKRFAKKIFNKE